MKKCCYWYFKENFVQNTFLYPSFHRSSSLVFVNFGSKIMDSKCYNVAGLNFVGKLKFGP